MTKPIYKKFIIFAFSKYYPTGGMDDIQGSEDAFDKAFKICMDHLGEDGWECCQIVDRDTWDIVWESDDSEK